MSDWYSHIISTWDSVIYLMPLPQGTVFNHDQTDKLINVISCTFLNEHPSDNKSLKDRTPLSPLHDKSLYYFMKELLDELIILHFPMGFIGKNSVPLSWVLDSFNWKYFHYVELFKKFWFQSATKLTATGCISSYIPQE